MPDLGLAPGEDSQRDDDTCGNAGQGESCRCPCPRPARGSPGGPEAGAGQDRPSEAGQVGVAIRGNLRADLNDAEHRQEDHHVRRPGRREARHSPAERQGDPGGGKHQTVAQDEGHRPGIDRERPRIERREVRGHDHLPEVEAQAVRRDGEPGRHAQLIQGGHAVDERLRPDREGRCRGGQEHERDLLHVDAARGLAPPPEGPAKPSERIDVQDQQHDRKTHRHRLGEKRAAEQRHREPVRSAAGRLPRVRPEVHQDRHEVEKSGEHIAPLGGPHYGFDALGMDGEHEGGKPCGSSERATAVSKTGQSQRQDLQDDDVEDHRVRGVQEEAGQMIPEGIHAPEHVVQAEGHPGQGRVVAHVERRPHPAEVGSSEPPILRVVYEILAIVPVHKLILQRWPEGSESDESDEHGHMPLDPARGRSADHRTVL